MNLFTSITKRRALIVGLVTLSIALAFTINVLSHGKSQKSFLSGSNQPKIIWSEQQIDVILSPGESTSKSVTFNSNLGLSNIDIEPVPEIAGFLSIQPSHFVSVPANQPQSIQITFSIPTSTTLGTYNGTIHVRSGSQTLPQTLKVKLSIWQVFRDPNLGLTFKFPPTWTASLLGSELTLSNVPLDTQPISESLVGICKIDFNTIEKLPGENLQEWLQRVNSENGGPPLTGITPIIIDSLSGLREIAGEIGTTDTVYLPLSDTLVLSIGLICGMDVQQTGEPVFQQVLSTVSFL